MRMRHSGCSVAPTATAPLGTLVSDPWLSVLRMRSKAWLAARVSLRLARLPRLASSAQRSRHLHSTRAAAPVLLAHAEVTENIIMFQWVQTLGTPRYICRSRPMMRPYDMLLLLLLFVCMVLFCFHLDSRVRCAYRFHTLMSRQTKTLLPLLLSQLLMLLLLVVMLMVMVLICYSVM